MLTCGKSEAAASARCERSGEGIGGDQRFDVPAGPSFTSLPRKRRVYGACSGGVISWRARLCDGDDDGVDSEDAPRFIAKRALGISAVGEGLGSAASEHMVRGQAGSRLLGTTSQRRSRQGPLLLPWYIPGSSRRSVSLDFLGKRWRRASCLEHFLKLGGANARRSSRSRAALHCTLARRSADTRNIMSYFSDQACVSLGTPC